MFSSGLVRLEIIFSMLLEVKEILEICKCLGGKKIKGNLNEVETHVACSANYTEVSDKKKI
jgi:hypothetical protein